MVAGEERVAVFSGCNGLLMLQQLTFDPCLVAQILIVLNNKIKESDMGVKTEISEK